MKKTSDTIQLQHTTMYFPKVEATYREVEDLYKLGQIKLSFFEQVLVDESICERIKDTQRLKNKEGYVMIKAFWSGHLPELEDDVKSFSNGDIDMIDLMFKYGIWYKQLQNFFIEMLPNVDVPTLWKQHKKHAQKRTTQQLYGVDHTAMLESVQEKRVTTTRERYGVDNAMYSKELREKLENTMMDRYGVRHNFQNKENVVAWYNRFIRLMRTDENWCKVLDTYPDKLPLIRRDFIISYANTAFVEDLFQRWIEIIGNPIEYPTNKLFEVEAFTHNVEWLRYFSNLGLVVIPEGYHIKNCSNNERLIMMWLNNLDVNYIRGNRTLLEGLEMDFYLPDVKIGIEVNPNSTHNSNEFALSTRRLMYESHKEEDYHYKKYKKAQEMGITLIQLFAYDLNPVRFEKLIAPMLEARIFGFKKRLYGKHVIVQNVSPSCVRDFLDDYHTQGFSPSNEHVGLYHQNELVGAASFKKKTETEWELKRLCFPYHTQIVGGLSKVVADFFRRHPEVETLISFSDNDYGDGQGYASAGAKFVKETGPSLRFISPTDGTDWYTWHVATPWGAKSGIVSKDAESKGLVVDNVDEYVELYLSHRTDDKCGYDRIYTSGSKKWVFQRPQTR